MKFHVATLGCKVNQVDSEQITDQLIQAGLTASPASEADIVVVNTCTVTKKADGKSLAVIKRALGNRANRYVFVTGCYSELEPDLAGKARGITAVISHTQKAEAGRYIVETIERDIESVMPKSFLPQSEKKTMHKIAAADLNSNQTRFYKHTRAFMKIQDGCNAFCSFCLIPYARGVPVSREPTDILKQVKALADGGFSEIVLTGVNIGEYRYGKKRFADILEAILERSSKTLIRVSTIEPHSVDRRIIDLFRHPNLSPHVHLALQGGVDRILRRMNRKYTTSEFYERLCFFREIDPYFAISTDVITGFPGESRKDFEKTCDFLKKCNFMKMHVFPFSPRPMTRASAFLDDVGSLEKKRRVDDLLYLSNQMHQSYLKKMQHRTQRVILEEKGSFSKPSLLKVFPPEQRITLEKKGYNVYQGTSEYYLKGSILTREKARMGEMVTAALSEIEPNVFLNSLPV